MTGKEPVNPLITPAEAFELSKHINVSETQLAIELFDFFRAHRITSREPYWDLACALAFIYDTGRVQGIREERAKRKRANAQNIAVNAF